MRRALLPAALLLLSGCGIVEEDGAYLSDRGAREVLGAARILAERGESVRAAEVYEGVALGYPAQHFADEALEGAARAREGAARSASGPARGEQRVLALSHWRRLRTRYPRSDAAPFGRYREGAILAGVLGGDPLCEEALGPLRDSEEERELAALDRARAVWLRARCLRLLGSEAEARELARRLLDLPPEITEEGTGVPLRVRGRGVLEGQEGSAEGSHSS
jgi:hypothetical protein